MKRQLFAGIISAISVSVGAGAITLVADNPIGINSDAVHEAYHSANTNTKEHAFSMLSQAEDESEEKKETKGGKGTTSGKYYEDLDKSLEVGKIIDDVSPVFKIYDGPPWEVTKGTYFFNFPKAKEDTLKDIEKAGIPLSTLDSYFVNSTVGVSNSYTLDGVVCTTVCVVPSWLEKGYMETGWKDHGTAIFPSGTPDSGAAQGKLKMCGVLCKKGEDITKRKNWLYWPITKGDSKAHTFPGGVIQTNIKLINADTIHYSSNWSGRDWPPFNEYWEEKGMQLWTSKSRVQLIKHLQEEINNSTKRTVSYNVGSWARNWFEVYDFSSQTLDYVRSNYDVCGIVVWEDSLP